MIPSAPLGTDAATGPLGLGAASGAGPLGDGPERRFRFELAAHPGSPAQARRLARARLAGWSVCEDTCDTAALVISELVTNAIVHTASSVVVCELRDGDELLRIAVRDEGCAPTEPHPCAQRTEEEQGRGLLLVEALCRAWGAQEHGTGLLVWVDLPRQADADAFGDAAGRGEADAFGDAAGRGEAEPGDDVAWVGITTDIALDTGINVDLDTGINVDLAIDIEAPRCDLGWGAPPKPGPAPGGSGEEEEAAERYDTGRRTA
ncbi:ATP-binding protein [Streptomyces sp. NPDC096205]|uniref:ATP-binding protein n=1 Tax=Streptomyces sp. NPDC096205 TaxID=3366081 RepID=UPI003810D070